MATEGFLEWPYQEGGVALEMRVRQTFWFVKPDFNIALHLPISLASQELSRKRNLVNGLIVRTSSFPSRSALKM